MASMSDPTPPTNAAEHAAARREIAVDWLVGRLRWEQILQQLHDRAEGAEPVAPVVALAAETGAPEARPQRRGAA